MNRKFVFYMFGRIAEIIALLLLVPALVALIYGEFRALFAFLLTAGLSFLGGFALAHICKTKNTIIYAKEGFVVVSLAWIGMSAIGAVPFVLSGDIPFYVDALFETVSGFTTTGSSILTDIEALSHAALFWRSFTHWVGGMGVLVFVMAIVSNMTDRSIHIMRAEMPGPVVGKLVPRAKDTAKILYLIYIVMTAIQVILLVAGGMPLFDSIVHTFGTAGTGGFGIKGDSLAGYSTYCQMVIATFMMLFAINFNLYYLVLIGRGKSVLKSTELWVFLGIIGVSVGLTTLNLYSQNRDIADCFRLSYFQVTSIISTSGFATADFNLWPSLSKGILLVLMFIGGCAGSTGGGLKVSRLVILFKLVLREIKHMLHPRSVTSVEFEGKAVDNQTLNSVSTYFACYAFCLIAVFLVICIEPFDFETDFTAAVTTFNNVGPGLGQVGPAGSFAGYSPFSKLVFSLAMLLGRLEIFPLVIALSPSTWRKR